VVVGWAVTGGQPSNNLEDGGMETDGWDLSPCPTELAKGKR
jgi:hypothetical protein